MRLPLASRGVKGGLEMKNVYVANGYKDRMDYLRHLAEDMDVDLGIVLAAADVLGPDEDFDGLITELEDFM